MDNSGSITMSMRELGRIKIIQAVIDGLLMPWRAAEQLKLSVRQVERLCRRYRDEGPAGLISRKRAHASNHQLPPGLAERVLGLVAKRYLDFGPTFACEKLREAHGFDLSVATVRRLMTAAGFWVPRKLRPPKIHQPRNRRACVGELIQIDGSDHRWFEERAASCVLLVFIDDATSRLMTLHFTQTESTFSYFEALRQHLDNHGKPMALYSDKFSVFRINGNRNEEKSFGKGITQFGRACFELNIDTWCANSSQAKGRVERANLTLQDRLVKELRLREISTKEAANAYAPSFIADYNRRFGKPPKSDHDAHRSVRNDEILSSILTVRVLRKVTQTLTVQYDRVMYLLEDTPANRTLIHTYIDVFEFPDGEVEIQSHGRPLTHTRYDRLSNVDQGAIVENKRLGHVLQIAQTLQAQRDNRRIIASPSRTHRGELVNPKHTLPGLKKQREINRDDFNKAIENVAQSKESQTKVAEQIVLKSMKRATTKPTIKH
ncbi:ISNCY family transposase [Robbsia sp. KACC 23696]|uniref:ISNCY family transposase n=1 Tax=Robbsia sp. KACC 23696 TaxID=3149231 RepID=UPI00325B81FD